MKNISYTVPYYVGTYLIRKDNDTSQLAKVNKYIIDEKGLSVILMLDVKTEPKLSSAISIEELLQNWKEDISLHISGDIGTRLDLGLDFEYKPILGSGPIRKLNK